MGAPEHHSEQFSCWNCEAEDVFVVSTTEFAMVDNLSHIGTWSPVFDKIKKVCPKCGEVSLFTLDVETYRGEPYYLIHEVDTD